jgi:lysophospholipase L1-like esterase
MPLSGNSERAATGSSALARLWVVPAIATAYFWLDCAFALRRGWSPRTSRLEVAALFLAGALSVVFVLALWRDHRRGGSSAAPRFALATLSALLTLGAVELALSALGERIERAPFHGHPRGLRQTFEPALPGTSNPARFSVNSMGLRGDEPPPDPSVFRILCVGGSTTEDVYLDDAKTWTRRLADELNARGGRRYWSASAGRSGFATIEHLRFLSEGETPDEFDAVVLLVGINDLARLVWGQSADRVAERAVGRAAPLWARLRGFELLRRIESARHPANQVMDREAIFVRTAQTVRAEARVVEGGLDVEPGIAAYRDRLRAIVAAAKSRNLPLVVVDQPTLFRPDLTPEEERRLWFLRRADGTYLPARRMRELMDRFNAATRDVAAEQGVTLVRLSELDGESELFYDDCHFSEAGAEAVARRVAEGVSWGSIPLRR